MALSRRDFLARGSALSLTGLSGCGPGLRAYGSFSACNPPSDGPLVIDSHCHLLNQKDGSARELVANRVLNLDETESPTVNWIVGTLAQVIGEILGTFTQTASRESEVLAGELRRQLLDPRDYPARQSNQALCHFAETHQSGIIRAGARRQITGFFSNRVRNAAQMMLLYPEVDLFLVSMVDFYEGITRVQYRNQISFYSNLALATRGRFLPIASFNPVREYDDRVKRGWGPTDEYEEKSQFWWLKRAINHLGFVGVKVHPSSGFSPIDNLAYGCTNHSRRYESTPDTELYARFTAYDRYMEELVDFCKEADVPILTHANLGLTTANQECMTGDRPPPELTLRVPPSGPVGRPEYGEWTYPFATRRRRESAETAQEAVLGAVDTSRAPEDYTSSPKAWVSAMDAADQRHPETPRAKVILAHFSGSIVPEDTSVRVTRAVPSEWLKSAARLVRENPNLHVDLSEISTLFETRNAVAYEAAFQKFLAQNPVLKQRLIYGSDWHMPGTALIGRDYIRLVKELFPFANELNRVMGTRAANLYGLRRGTLNLARLEAFFATAPTVGGVPRANPSDPSRDPSLRPEQINWWAKI